MIFDPLKSYHTNKGKSLSQDWTNLIKELKSQSKPQVDLPPIVFKTKSPLSNYKNAQKLQQVHTHKRTITQKILDLSKRRKMANININQDINKHRRFASQHIYTLTAEEKQLLDIKEIQNAQRLLDLEKSKAERINIKQVIKQIKEFQQEEISKEKSRQKNTKGKQRKDKKSINLLQINQTQSFQTIEAKYGCISQAESQRNQQMKDQEIFKNQKLSFELSKDYRSLHYRYEKQMQESLRFEQSIPKMLFKNRKQKVQQIFPIIIPEDLTIESERVQRPLFQQQASLQQTQQVGIEINQTTFDTKRSSVLNIDFTSAQKRCKAKRLTNRQKFINEKKEGKKSMLSHYEPWESAQLQDFQIDCKDANFTIEEYNYSSEQIQKNPEQRFL